MNSIEILENELYYLKKRLLNKYNISTAVRVKNLAKVLIAYYNYQLLLGQLNNNKSKIKDSNLQIAAYESLTNIINNLLDSK